jgi:DNA-binding MarR family transcriptional regulator
MKLRPRRRKDDAVLAV